MSKEEKEAGSSVPSPIELTAEFFTLAGVASLLSTSTTLGAKVYKLLNPQEPFFTHINDSYSEKDKYVVELVMDNLDVHALYVESIALEEPLKVSEVENVDRVTASMVKAPTPAFAFPFRIESGESKALRLVLVRPPEKTKYGTANVKIARLGEKSTETKIFHFLIRGS